MAELKMSIENCAKTLAEAQAEWEKVELRKRGVDSEMTAATNKLNKAQKTFDEAVAELRKAAPWNTDWHSERKRGCAA